MCFVLLSIFAVQSTANSEHDFCTNMAAAKLLPARRVVAARQMLEGAGFPVWRPLPGPELGDQLDPFLLLDIFGKEWAPGEAVGAPWHPHRGFSTITACLAGDMEHNDSSVPRWAHADALRP